MWCTIDFYKQTDNRRGSGATGKACMYFQSSRVTGFFLLVICHCLALCHSFVLEDVVRLVERAMVTQQWSRAGRVGWYQQKRSLMISKGFPNSWSYNCAMDFKHAASPKWFKSVDTHWAGKVQSFVPLLQNKQGAVVFTKLGQFCSTIWCKLPYIVRTNSVILTIRSDNQNDTETGTPGCENIFMIWINMVRLIVVTSVLDLKKIELFPYHKYIFLNRSTSLSLFSNPN